MVLNESVVTQDEKTNAMLAHASIVLGLFSRGTLGILLAFLIWVTQRNKSRFASREAAQAAVYQLIGLLVTIIVWIVWGLMMAGSIAIPVLLDPRRPEIFFPFTMIPALALIVFPLAVSFGWVVYGIYAAVQVWHGKDFSYPVMGNWVK